MAACLRLCVWQVIMESPLGRPSPEVDIEEGRGSNDNALPPAIGARELGGTTKSNKH